MHAYTETHHTLRQEISVEGGISLKDRRSGVSLGFTDMGGGAYAVGFLREDLGILALAAWLRVVSE
jgi:hypothetical protein